MPRKTATAPKKASGPSTRIVAAWIAAGLDEDRIAELCGISREQAAEAITAARELTTKLREQDAALQAQHGTPIRTEAEWLRCDVYLAIIDLRRRLSRVLSRNEVAGDEVDAARDRIHDATLAARAMWLTGREQEAWLTLLDARELLGMLRHDPRSMEREAQMARGASSGKSRRETSDHPDRTSAADREKYAKRLYESKYPRDEIIALLIAKGVTKRQAQNDCKAAGIPTSRQKKAK